MNVIAHGTNNPVAVCYIFDCTGHMEGGNTNNSNFIRYCMKGIIDELDPRKELFDLTNSDGYKVVQVAGEVLEVDHQNLTCMLRTLHEGNTCFSDICKLDFVKNLIRVSNLLHRVFGLKFHHYYEFFQKLSVISSKSISTTLPECLR